MIYKLSVALALGFLLASCSNENKQDSKNELNSKNEEEAQPHKPLLFPFNFEERELKLMAKRKRVLGDCETESELYQKAENRVFKSETRCSEYTIVTRFYYFEEKDLIAVHTKEIDNTVHAKNGKMLTIRSEKTVNFREKSAFLRSDTVAKNVKNWIEKEFTEIEFESNQAFYLESYEDLSQPLSYSKNATFKVRSNQEQDGNIRSVFLEDAEFMGAYTLLKANNFMEIKDFKSNGIPADAKFAFSTWWAGGGQMVYGKLDSGVLKIYERFDEETLPMQPFHLLRVIDPNVNASMPSYYIQFKEDKGKAKNIQVAFNEKGDALYAKYAGKERQIELELNKDLSQGSTIKKRYDEILLGIKSGSYTITHQGNYDYLTYTTRDGKVFNYTIDFKKSEENGEYKKTPHF
ncbi:hypothetical protein N9089_02430 [Crocinitomicaceae bacterium]|nr:hypothetical protein [Crocinitomicaceae bacterium]